MGNNINTTYYNTGDLINVEGYNKNNNPSPVQCKVILPGTGFIGIEVLNKELDSGKNLITDPMANSDRRHWYISTNKIIKNLNSYFNNFGLNSLDL